ncbi:MAG TPA: Crp/Fnr family transcriptional regulator [Solirubrobacteraceae bacterium]|nr:Crp/Fnr family transcriptional regulator [Solirubrobacteraceae bacterium]
MSATRVLSEDPELAEAIPRPLRAQAIEDCVVPVRSVGRGRWRPESGGASWVGPGGIGLLVLEGLLIRRVGVDDRFGAELLGQGDLLRPWQGEAGSGTISPTTGWRVLEATRLAVLDETAARRMAPYPQLTGALVARAVERSRSMAVNMAIIHQARVNVRLLMLLWHLADRWGRVRSEGVLLPLRLTHSVLADLVAARRPTVTTSLTDLARQALVEPQTRGWLLLGEPPGELLELERVYVGAGAG